MSTKMPISPKAAILECARTIRPYLAELVGPNPWHPPSADEMDRDLASLLEESKTGRNVAEPIMKILTSHEGTSAWTYRFLQGQYSNYNPLVGDPDILTPGKCACPGGDFVWYQRSSGTTPPLCPTHGFQLNCG